MGGRPEFISHISSLSVVLCRHGQLAWLQLPLPLGERQRILEGLLSTHLCPVLGAQLGGARLLLLQHLRRLASRIAIPGRSSGNSLIQQSGPPTDHACRQPHIVVTAHGRPLKLRPARQPAHRLSSARSSATVATLASRSAHAATQSLRSRELSSVADALACSTAAACACAHDTQPL